MTTEPGLEVAAVMVRPAGAGDRTRVVLLLDAEDKSLVGLSPLAQGLLESGVALLALDPRGMGETAVHVNQLTSDTVCLGRHLFAQRVWDVMQAAEYLRARDDIDPDGIGFFGAEAAGLLGLTATALGASFERVALRGSLASYRFAFENGQPQPIWAFVPKLLGVADLPQIAALAAPTPVLWTNPVGHGRRPLPEADACAEFAFTARVYELLGHADRLSVTRAEGEERIGRLSMFLRH